jgi:hypothetical protein
MVYLARDFIIGTQCDVVMVGGTDGLVQECIHYLFPRIENVVVGVKRANVEIELGSNLSMWTEELKTIQRNEANFQEYQSNEVLADIEVRSIDFQGDICNLVLTLVLKGGGEVNVPFTIGGNL